MADFGEWSFVFAFKLLTRKLRIQVDLFDGHLAPVAGSEG